MKGTVISYFAEKTYGFIKPDEGEENIFARAELEIDSRVEFDTIATSRGTEAINIKKI